MSASLNSLLTTSSTPSTASRPVRERKKTPKAAALSNRAPSSSKKAVPLTLPPFESLEVCNDGITSSTDILLALVAKALPETTDENTPAENEEVDHSHIEKKQSETLSNQQMGKKRKLAPSILLKSTVLSPVTPLNNDRFNANSPTLSGNSPNVETPGQKRNRKLPILHGSSICSNCGTSETTLWRRNEEGAIECNSCYLYFKKRGIKRPMSLQNREIVKRSRKSGPASTEKDEELGMDIERMIRAITTTPIILNPNTIDPIIVDSAVPSSATPLCNDRFNVVPKTATLPPNPITTTATNPEDTNTV